MITFDGVYFSDLGSEGPMIKSTHLELGQIRSDPRPCGYINIRFPWNKNRVTELEMYDRFDNVFDHVCLIKVKGII